MVDSRRDNSDLLGDETPEQELLPPSQNVLPVTTLTIAEQLFCIKYVELQRNARQAAIAAGYAPSNAPFLLRRPAIRARIIELAGTSLRRAGLDMDEMLAQIHAIATFDRRKLYHPDGTRKLFTELDAKTAAAISHMGPNDFQPFNKLQAIDMAMKHLGGFEKDNDQRRENLSINVTLV